MFSHLDEWCKITIARLPAAAKYPQFRSLFNYEKKYYQDKINLSLAMNPEAVKFKEYKPFFQNYSLQPYVAFNPNAALLPEYAQFFEFDRQSYEVIVNVASNPNAVRFPEYKKLITLDYKYSDLSKTAFIIRRMIACNPAARTLPEYADLIPPEYGLDKETIEQNVDKLRFKEYINMQPNKEPLKSLKELENADEETLEKNYARLRDSDIITDSNFLAYFKDPNYGFPIADNLAAIHLDIFQTLFDSKVPELLSHLACKEYLTILPGYKKLFKHKELDILVGIASNSRAVLLNEFKALFFNKNEHVQKGLIKNLNAKKHPEYALLFSSPYIDNLVLLAEDPEAVNFPEFKNLLTHKDPSVRIVAAKNPNAVRFTEFGQLFYDYTFIMSNIGEDFVIQVAAKNKNAPAHPEFRKLFTRPPPPKTEDFFAFIFALSEAAKRPESAQFPEFKAFMQLLDLNPEHTPTPFLKQWNNVIQQAVKYYHDCTIDNEFHEYISRRIQSASTYNFMYYIGYLGVVYEGIAANPAATKLEGFNKIFNLENVIEYIPVIQALFYNSEAQKLPEFGDYKKKILNDYHTRSYVDYINEKHQMHPLRRSSFYIARKWQNQQVLEREFHDFEMHQNPRLYDSQEYRMQLHSIVGELWIAKDSDALQCPEFQYLFYAQDINVRYAALRTYYNRLNEQFCKINILPYADNIPKEKKMNNNIP